MQQNLQLRWCLKCVCFGLFSFAMIISCAVAAAADYYYCLPTQQTQKAKCNNSINSMASCALHRQRDDESKGVSSRCYSLVPRIILLSNEQQASDQTSNAVFVLDLVYFVLRVILGFYLNKKRRTEMHTHWNSKKLNRRSLTKCKKNDLIRSKMANPKHQHSKYIVKCALCST